ncbi:MAG TPA: diaminopimelate epimerase, partial [Candidatus Brocadiia bacterium]|nr:diaminopimelate epimerase [Candidatus Brocadiia bacterium]
MRFVKMHGNGNDFVLVDLWRESVSAGPDLAREICDRHFGVGADGLVLVGPSTCADARMLIYNSDGSEAEMCGNAIRCVAEYCFDIGIHAGAELRVETKAGVKRITMTSAGGRMVSACVDMGAPRLARADIPMRGQAAEQCVDEPFE